MTILHFLRFQPKSSENSQSSLLKSESQKVAKTQHVNAAILTLSVTDVMNKAGMCGGNVHYVHYKSIFTAQKLILIARPRAACKYTYIFGHFSAFTLLSDTLLP